MTWAPKRRLESLVGLAPTEGGPDTLGGGPGNDVLRAGPGGPGDGDLLNGSEGTDTVSYEHRSGGVVVSIDGIANDGSAGEGDNVASDAECLTGGAASDVLVGSDSDNCIDGRGGSDTINGLGGADSLEGGAADPSSDVLLGGTGIDTLQGSAGDDLLRGEGDGDALLAGGGGSDELHGGDGDDRAVTGGPGTDTLDGGAGNDSLNGSDVVLVGVDGNDALKGGTGNDALAGGDGDDTIDGGAGVDEMSGGGGEDTASYVEARAPVTVTLDGLANDGSPGENDLVRTDIEDIRGGGVADTLIGDRKRNELEGGTGEDYLDGAADTDVFSGGDQIDVIRARDRSAETVQCGSGKADYRHRRLKRPGVGQLRAKGHGQAEPAQARAGDRSFSP